MSNHQTILALDPGLRDLGYAVLAGPGLVHAGVQTFRFVPPLRRHREALAVVRSWIKRYEPDVLVLETTPSDHEPPFAALRRWEHALRRLAIRSELACVRYSAQTVRKALLGNGWAGKRDIAVTLAARYPMLRIYVKQNRAWKESFFHNMFDAVALAVHHQAVTA